MNIKDTENNHQKPLQMKQHQQSQQFNLGQNQIEFQIPDQKKIGNQLRPENHSAIFEEHHGIFFNDWNSYLEQYPLLSHKIKFDDDDPIQILEKNVQEERKENVKPNIFDLDKKFQFKLKSMTKAIKLNSKEIQHIPAMISLETLEEKDQSFDLNQRPAIDLICVIDSSGSMNGEKMRQVKITLTYLLELLNENDRIMLVQFERKAQRILPFTRTSKFNEQKIKKTINSIKARGGTSIVTGMRLALQGIKQRKFQNPVTSIFLLSDGRDGSGYSLSQNLFEQEGNIEGNPYTVNSFGFGARHDPVLMNKICQYKDGNFYYVKDITTVDEMFIDALGGLFSVVAQNLEITTKLQKDNNIFSDVMVKKTYGEMWKFDENNNEYKINIVQMISGVSKEFLLVIQLPPIDHKLQDFQRNAILLSSEITLYLNDDKEKNQPIHKKAQLELTFYNENEEIPKEIGEVDDNVQVNYFRVRGAEMIQACMEQAEEGNFQKGQEIIKGMQKDIENTSKQNRQKLQMLFDDLSMAKETCTEDRYQSEGRFNMIQNKKAHMEQKSKAGVSQPQEASYQNQTQSRMVSQRQDMKNMLKLSSSSDSQ